MKGGLVSATAIAVAMATSAPSYAQQGTVPDGATEAREDGIDDIVVTANRRSESVQNVPLSITAVSGDALAQAGVSQAADLQTIVPGLAIAQSGAATVTVLRGVGSFVNDANAEAAIAYNINGVYIARPAGIGPIFYDLSRVEVLKGPQGTLYGRNASGGAINLITTRPGRSREGYASIDVGNYDLVKLTGAITVPMGDSFSVRAAGQYTRRDGYLTDGYDDQKSEAGRLTALWNPTEALSLLVTGEYTHVGGAGSGAVRRSTLRTVPANPWAGPSEPASQPPSAGIPGGTVIRPGGPNDLAVWAISAELNYDFGPVQLTFIPAYRDTNPEYTTYNPGFLFRTAETSRQQSYELRLGNEAERLKWVGGLYYFDEAQTQRYLAQALPFQSSLIDTTLGTKSWAAFGEATYGIADRLRLTAGIRYSNDRKRQDGTSTATLPRPGVVNNFARRNYDNVSWKGGIEFDLAPKSLLFANVATGYKAGGFFPSVAAPNNEFAPEKLTAFTFGSRNRFANNTLQVNLEGFYWKYHDKQERFLGVTQAGTTAILTTNAGKATLFGGAVDIQYRPTRRDALRFNAEYLHTNYDEFGFTTYNPAPFGTTVGYSRAATGCRIGPIVPLTSNDPFVPTDSTQRLDCSGMPLVRAPEWSGSASYEHVFELRGGATITPMVSAQFATKQFVSTDFIASAQDDGFVTVDASITFAPAGDRFSIQAWIRNIGEQAIYSGGFRYPYSAPASVGGDPSLFYSNIRAPRTFGATLRAGF